VVAHQFGALRFEDMKGGHELIMATYDMA